MNLMKYFKSNKMFYAFVITMLLISCSSESQSSDPFSSADELTKSSENKSSNIDNTSKNKIMTGGNLIQNNKWEINGLLDHANINF